MNKEEIEAIEIIKEYRHDFKCEHIYPYLQESIDIILNLIEKQQKEIEEKNCLIDVLQHRIEELLDNKKEINYIKPIDIPVHNYINEDKIREKIKKYQEKAEDVKQKYKGVYAYKDDYLEALAKIEGYQELLEEN